jgi:integrase
MVQFFPELFHWEELNRRVTEWQEKAGEATTRDGSTLTATSTGSGLPLGLTRRPGRFCTSVGKNLETYLRDWLELDVKPKVAPNTYRQYSWIIDSHIVPHLGKRLPDKVTRKDVQALIATKAKQKVASRAKDGDSNPSKTLSRTVLRLIKAVLHAAYEDVVAANPASHVDLPKSQKAPPVFLQLDEVALFRKAIPETDLKAFWLFMLNTGTRLAEASGIRWADVDLDSQLVFVRGQLLRLDGKLQYVPATKTNQDRVLSIPDEVVQALRELQTRQATLQVTEPDPDGIVFLNPYGRRLDPKYVRDELHLLCDKAGVRRISPHKIRHTMASHAAAAMGSTFLLQKQLSHSQGALTNDLYGSATLEGQRKLTEALSQKYQTADQSLA